MEAQVVTFGDMGTVRATVRNPYTTARRFDIEVFDTEWNRVDEARLTRTSLALAPGAQTSVFALLPSAREGAREIYLCATSRAYRPTSAGLRGQVCGRYRIVRRVL